VKRRLAAFLLLLLILAASFALVYGTRAFIPYPSNYMVRLRWLKGWQSKGYYGFNCSGFLTNAHNERYLSERELYAGGHGRLLLVDELSDIRQIDESKLQPGDIAAFQGPTVPPYLGRGVHAAAFLAPGVWIDADTRRGSVATWRMQDKSPTDPWFQNRVRILRWPHDARPRWQLAPVADWWFMSDFVRDYRLRDHFAVTAPVASSAHMASSLPARRLTKATLFESR
jgi:hypothetical protein